MKKRITSILYIVCTASAILLTGCSKTDTHGLSAKNPTSIKIWHYYNGALATAFDGLVSEFNNTVGRESGIVVNAESMGTVSDLENALWDSANEKIGAPDMPNIFQCYQDTAYALDKEISLVNFDDYVTEDEKKDRKSTRLNSSHIH